MYWIFVVIFILTVLTPDIVRKDLWGLSEVRIEEIFIFLMGAITFIIFIRNEQKILFHKKEKEKNQKKIDQTVKDLMDSYSYIGEVNRKMDLLINIALGLTDRSVLSKSKENEIYHSVVSASNFLLKSEFTSLRFVCLENLKTRKEIRSGEGGEVIKNNELAKIEEDMSVKRYKNCLIVSSSQKIGKIKSYIITCGYDKKEENSPKNMEILKVLASQALFLYSFTHSEEIQKNSQKLIL